MCHFLSLQQWEVVGRGDLVADISVFLILLLSCGLIGSWGMYSCCYKTALAGSWSESVSWSALHREPLNSIVYGCNYFRTLWLHLVHVCQADILLYLSFFFTMPKTVFKLVVICLGESDCFLPAALDAVGQFWTRTPWAPCITEDSSMCTELEHKKQHVHITHQKRYSLTWYILCYVKLNCTTEG